MSEPTLSDLLGGSAAPFPVTHAGKTWKVGPPTKAARDFFNKALIAAAVADAAAADAEFPGLGELVRVSGRIRRREHLPGGPLWLEQLSSPVANPAFLASLLYAGGHADVTLADAEGLLDAAPDAVAAATGVMVPDFFALVLADERMPRALREALAGQLPAILAAFRPSPQAGGSTPPSSP